MRACQPVSNDSIYACKWSLHGGASIYYIVFQVACRVQSFIEKLRACRKMFEHVRFTSHICNFYVDMVTRPSRHFLVLLGRWARGSPYSALYLARDKHLGMQRLIFHLWTAKLHIQLGSKLFCGQLRDLLVVLEVLGEEKWRGNEVYCCIRIKRDEQVGSSFMWTSIAWFTHGCSEWDLWEKRRGLIIDVVTLRGGCNAGCLYKFIYRFIYIYM